MRAKFRVNSVTFHGDPNPTAPRTYELSAVYDQSTEENRRFNQATPWAEMKMRVDNPDAQLTVGEMYYLDFTECTKADAEHDPAKMGNTHNVTGVYTPGHAATHDDITPADPHSYTVEDHSRDVDSTTRTTPSGEPVDTIDASGRKVPDSEHSDR